MEVNLRNLKRNLVELKKFQKKIIPVVKSNGYGLGVKEVARALSDETDFLAVGNIEEAHAIADAGIKKEILILNPLLPKEYNDAIKRGFIFPLESKKDLRELFRKSRNRKKPRIHLEIDTGMGRSGVPYGDAVKFIKDVVGIRNINFMGIYTHLSAPDMDSGFTKEQIAKFLNVLSNFDFSNFPLIHAASSAGFISYKELMRKPFNTSRIGLLIYGIMPETNHMTINVKLNDVVKVKAVILRVQEVKKGTTIGYGITFKAPQRMKIATVATGYSWGLFRKLTNKGKVLVKGKRARIIGSVCMDLTVIDVTGIPGVKPGDEVVLIGKQGRERIDINEVAKIVGTIPYEILTNFGNALEKKYIFK